MSRLIYTIQELGAKQVWTSLLLSKRVPRKIEVDEVNSKRLYFGLIIKNPFSALCGIQYS